MIVLDASAAVALFLDRPLEAASLVRTRLLAPGADPCAPDVFDLEVVQALRNMIGRKELSVDRATAALRQLADLAPTRYPHAPLVDRIWQLRENLTAYDAAYVALAEALDAPLITRDARISRAPHRARVEVI